MSTGENYLLITRTCVVIDCLKSISILGCLYKYLIIQTSVAYVHPDQHEVNMDDLVGP